MGMFLFTGMKTWQPLISRKLLDLLTELDGPLIV